MQFIDTITPSLPSQYYDTLKTVDNRSSWKDKPFQAANDWAAMYYQNAYATAMQNYMNEYNSPLQQMLRYQEAGINPFLAANDPGNMGSSPSGSAPRGNFSAPTSAQVTAANAGAVNQSVNSLNQTLKTAQGLYEYITYGRPLQEINLGTAGINQNIASNNELLAYYNQEAARSNAVIKDAEAAWATYWNLGRGPDGEDIANSPRGLYMFNSTERIAAQVDQLRSLVDVLYPAQADRARAAEALDSYKKQILEGQNDAILTLDTGNPERDAIIKQVLFWIQNRLQVKL